MIDDFVAGVASLLVILLAIVLFGGCRPASTENAASSEVRVLVKDYNAFGGKEMFEVRGVVCVSWKVGNAGGLSCDWTRYEGE